jgi:hypothetical protein
MRKKQGFCPFRKLLQLPIKAQTELKALNKEDNESIAAESSSSSTEEEDCQFCRSLDFDLIFAFTFAVVVGLMLILIMIFWLNGVFQYKE